MTTMRAAILMLLLVVGCDDSQAPVPALPDAGADAGACEFDYCEAINAPPACFAAPCDCTAQDPGANPIERVCGNEKVCQEWPDCTSPQDPDPHPCVQCRTLFWCACE
jgi:hypothetical protein